MKKNILNFVSRAATLGVLLSPITILAYEERTFRDLIDLTITYLGYAIPLIVTLAIVSFVWGIYRKFFKPDADPKEAGSFVLYGVIGFFVILSFWGLVNILINTFEFQDPTHIRVPFVGNGF
jgi:uncharacterized membrane protein